MAKNPEERFENSPEKTKKKKKKRKVNPIKRTLAVIGTTILSLFLIVIITSSIIAAALTVYVLQFADQDTVDISLSDLNLDYTTFIYGYDENDALVELASISRNADRIPVSIDRVPQHVQDAFVYTEDERFYEHAGVDWKRTFTAFLNEILDFLGSRQGGSTITQQLVKNVTGDKEANWDRKMREIFRAAQLERYSPKPTILEAYLNYIGFGGSAAGIQSASLKYFGKDVSELTIAEGACLAAIPQSPEVLNPFYKGHADEKGEYAGIFRTGKERNLARQKTVLWQMYKNACISKKQYEEALAEEKQFVYPNAKKDDDDDGNDIQDWFVDMVIYDVISEFQDMYGIEQDEASDMLYNGGYEIYTTVDIEMQKTVEAKYKDYTTFSENVLADPPESAFICMDYSGNIKAVVGRIGEKSGSNVWNIATRSPRQPGSCIKPITSYGYGIENDFLTWSTVFTNKPLDTPVIDEDGVSRKWPYNYNSKTWDYGGYYTFQALQRSLNTIPAQLIEKETPQAVFEFLQNRFQITTLVADDANIAPLSVGALTKGLTLKELVAAYQPFGNGGKYYRPTSYTQVVDANGKVVLEHKYTPIQSISKESAYVMNKLLQTVIEGPNGTGRAARLVNTPLIGKTGTSQNWWDLSFVGCTPDYVSGVWYGYETPKEIPTGTYYSSSQVWKNVFGDIAEKEEGKEFPECQDVRELYYCTKTGLLASGTCPTGSIGYYKSTNIPEMCSGHHEEPKKEEDSSTASVDWTVPAVLH
ncbi:MAG: peptidoglycan glycosyltransferase [Ruminococcus sp.]|nr:peptidoglycan glycosyltransferase [Ruminococcus sp.]